MQVTLRITATPEQAQSLVTEWLSNMDGPSPVTITLPSQDTSIEVPLTYVKEQ